MSLISGAELLATGVPTQALHTSDRLVFCDGQRLWSRTSAGLAVTSASPDLQLIWAPEGVRLQQGGRAGVSPARSLPYGARTATHCYRYDTGWVWDFDGWLYRRRDGEAPCAVGRLADGAALLVGHDGSVLIGDGDEWFQGASPHGTVLRDIAPLDAGWNVVLTGGLARGVRGRLGVMVDLLHGNEVAEHRSRRPWGLGVWAKVPQGVPHARGGSWARSDDLLAGPGGHLWHLRAGERVTVRPTVRSGRSSWHGKRLWTEDEYGRGVWVAADGSVGSGEVPQAQPAPVSSRVAVADTWLYEHRVGDVRWLWSDEGALVRVRPAGSA